MLTPDQFVRVLPVNPGENWLKVWLTPDAIARITSGGGRFDSGAEVLEVLDHAEAAYDGIAVGLAEPYPWQKTAGNSDPDATSDQILVYRGHRWFVDVNALRIQRAMRDGDTRTADFLSHITETALVGGLALDGRGEGIGAWVICDLDVHPADSPAALLAAAVLMVTDPDERRNAACTSSTSEVLTTHAVERIAAKRGKKGKKPRTIKSFGTDSIHVVDIRHPDQARLASLGVGRGTREYHYRWTVRGHWRNQPCGPGRTQRKRIWIADHEAGPEHLPLRPGQRVFRID